MASKASDEGMTKYVESLQNLQIVRAFDIWSLLDCLSSGERCAFDVVIIDSFDRITRPTMMSSGNGFNKQPSKFADPLIASLCLQLRKLSSAGAGVVFSNALDPTIEMNRQEVDFPNARSGPFHIFADTVDISLLVTKDADDTNRVRAGVVSTTPIFMFIAQHKSPALIVPNVNAFVVCVTWLISRTGCPDVLLRPPFYVDLPSSCSFSMGELCAFGTGSQS